VSRTHSSAPDSNMLQPLLDFNISPPPTPFRGASYVPHLDGERLETQLARIVRFMVTPPGIYRTVAEIRSAMEERYPDVGWPENSIQAQLRNSVKIGYRKAKRRRGDPRRGVFEFALWLPEGP
jgi:hypothetical protein